MNAHFLSKIKIKIEFLINLFEKEFTAKASDFFDFWLEFSKLGC